MILQIILMLFTFWMANIANYSKVKKHRQVDGTKFPAIESKSLAGEKVRLPDDVNGEITMITIAFLEEGQPYINSWADPYLDRYFGKDGFNYFEVPMLNEMPQSSKNYIDSGMRAGIKKELHPNVVTFYGDYSNYVNTLDMKDLRSGYAFLLNRDGNIIYHGEGMMTDQNWEELTKIIEQQD